jgi:hypothetical protein
MKLVKSVLLLALGFVLVSGVFAGGGTFCDVEVGNGTWAYLYKDDTMIGVAGSTTDNFIFFLFGKDIIQSNLACIAFDPVVRITDMSDDYSGEIYTE